MKVTQSQVQQYLAALAATLTIISQTAMFPLPAAKACGIVGFVIALFFVELSKCGAQPAAAGLDVQIQQPGKGQGK